MRHDGKAPTPPWLRGLDELEEREEGCSEEGSGQEGSGKEEVV